MKQIGAALSLLAILLVIAGASVYAVVGVLVVVYRLVDREGFFGALQVLGPWFLIVIGFTALCYLFDWAMKTLTGPNPDNTPTNPS